MTWHDVWWSRTIEDERIVVYIDGKYYLEVKGVKKNGARTQ